LGSQWSVTQEAGKRQFPKLQGPLVGQWTWTSHGNPGRRDKEIITSSALWITQPGIRDAGVQPGGLNRMFPFFGGGGAPYLEKTKRRDEKREKEIGD